MRGIFITARLKSTRLPGKALIDVNGRPLLFYQLQRLRESTEFPVVLCTSTNQQDDALEMFAEQVGCPCFRGSEEDVLERYLQCAKAYGITRMYITYADEPLLDIDLIHKTFVQLEAEDPIWVDNSDYPDGSFGYGLNERAIKLINELKGSRENEVWGPMVVGLPVTIVKNAPPVSRDKSKYRLTVDYPEDLEMFRVLSNALGDDLFTMDIGDVFDAYDRLALLTVNGFRNVEYLERLRAQGNATLTKRSS